PTRRGVDPSTLAPRSLLSHPSPTDRRAEAAPGFSPVLPPPARLAFLSRRNRGMNRDPILFRVDAGPRTSYEHLARCGTYAAALQRRRRPTYFLSQLEPRSLALPIKRAGNEWLDADAPVGTAEDLTETIQEIRRLRPAAVIVDAPTVTADYLNEIQATGVLLVSLDHAAAIRFSSQILINPLLGPGKETYEFVPG